MALIFHLKSTLKCRQQIVSIWTSLKFSRLGQKQGQILGKLLYNQKWITGNLVKRLRLAT